MHDFNEIYGNEKIIEYMQKVIKLDKIPHAFILSGQMGMGKKLLGKTFAKTLQCEEGNVNPCNKCKSCKQFESNNHPDVFFITPVKKKSIGIDDIRESINNEIMIKPYSSKYKIFIIDKSETITTQAQNALLKNIEEPPPYGIFIFLTSNYNDFLATIISRCVLLKLKPLSKDTIKKYLVEKKELEGHDVDSFATYGNGSIGKSLLLLEDEEFISMQNYIIDMLMGIRKNKTVDIFNIASNLEKFKQKIDIVLDIMSFWYRDLIIYKTLNNENYILDKNNIGFIKRNALDYSLEKLYDIIEEINKASSKLKYNSNFQLTMEVLLLNIKE